MKIALSSNLLPGRLRREPVENSFMNLGYIFILQRNVCLGTGNPGSVIVPQYGSGKITVFVRAKNTILKFLGNTE